MLIKVISGAQRGTDIAGLRAAKKVGLQTGGFIPLGFRTLDGNHPEYKELYGIEETSSSDYPIRTKKNVSSSDGTMRIAHNFNSAGERCTLNAINSLRKPFLDIPIVNGVIEPGYGTKLIEFIIKNNILILNVAGNSTIGIEKHVEEFLVIVFSYLLRD